MAYTTIDDPSAHFHTQLYTGNGSSGLSITNDANAGDFQPDLLWIMPRSNGDNGVCFDSTRGEDRQLKFNGNDAEDTHSPARVTFESDGFDLDTTDTNYNGSSRTYVAWQWKVNGGSTTTNDASSTGVGSIDSVYQANTTAGISVLTYTGTGSAGTIAHGIGSAPKGWIMVKRRDDSDSWLVQNGGLGATKAINLEGDSALQTYTPYWNDTAPTNTVFSVGDDGRTNGNTETYVAFCFAEVQGFSRFGVYKGNYNTDGPFIYTGFKPAWVTVKEGDNANDWDTRDAARNSHNPVDNWLRFNTTDAEGDSDGIDFLSNGFKIRQASNRTNRDGGTMLYMAFAEHPFVSSEGVPCTAR